MNWFLMGSKNDYPVMKQCEHILKKFKIKCERIFEISPRNKVVGFTSKNQFI